MRVLALALGLCFIAGPVAAATKTFVTSSAAKSSHIKRSKVKVHSNVKRGPKASKLKRANARPVARRAASKPSVKRVN
jgi:hypothetical protein